MARPRGDIAPRILHAARQRFLAEGVDGASLRAIARDARTNIGMIYYYFPNKDDLFLAVVEEIYVGLLDKLEAALDRTRPVIERLHALYERLGTLSADERDVVRLVVREVLASPARLERLLARFMRGHIPLLLDLVRDGMATGVFRGDMPVGLLLAAVGALGGPAQLLLGAMEERLPPTMIPRAGGRAGALVDLLLHGVAQPARGSKSKARAKQA
jgi:AcrR family transcriptional regulator